MALRRSKKAEHEDDTKPMEMPQVTPQEPKAPTTHRARLAMDPCPVCGNAVTGPVCAVDGHRMGDA